MNIVILNWRDIKHPLAGGAEQSLFNHALYWQKKGAKITWVASSFKKAKKTEIINGIKTIRFGSHFTVHLLAAINYKNIINTDIVIDSFHFLPFFTPIYEDKKKIIALINEPAKNAWFENIFFPASYIGFLIEPFFFKLYKKIPFITSAESIKKEIVKIGIVPREINIIPHGVTIKKSLKKFNKNTIPTLIYLSQVSPDKGVEDAIKAFTYLINLGTRANLLILGKPISKEYENKIKKLIKKSDFRKYIIYNGFVSEDKKFELLQKSWILIHPSIREGWGLNVIEANTFGIPAVGYNVVGLKDSIQDNLTGLLTQFNTPKNLADNCLTLINDKTLYNKLSKNAREWAKEFSWEIAGEKSWNLLKTRYEKSKN